VQHGETGQGAGGQRGQRGGEIVVAYRARDRQPDQGDGPDHSHPTLTSSLQTRRLR
jgi:hypothetical protein